MEWRPIESPPSEPCGVLYWLPDAAHSPGAGILSHGWDYSLQIGYWDGLRFHEQGTGHEIDEREDLGGAMPTHWMPLPAPPVQKIPPEEWTNKPSVGL